MKIITIGRGDDNQIVLDDSQDLISRQHATLRIYETGKMEIVSTGSNGTFVNGFRIKPNMPYKVTRKDVVSFAHVRQLDWALVPDPFRLVRYGLIGGVIAILVGIAVFLLWPEKKSEPVTPIIPNVNVVPVTPEPTRPKEETAQEKPKEDEVKEKNERDKVVPTKRFLSAKPKEDKEKKEKQEQENPAEVEEANPQNQVF